MKGVRGCYCFACSLAIILLYIIARFWFQPRMGFVPKDKTVKDRFREVSPPHEVIMCLSLPDRIVKKNVKENCPNE